MLRQTMQTVHLILYVGDQKRSASFYRQVLGYAATLDVPGMTEFPLTNGAVLGLMPTAGIKALLGPALPDPAAADGIPRAELYLLVENPETLLQRALAAGAGALSPVQRRNWGDEAGYCLDPDGHVVAFARRPSDNS